MTTNPLAEFCLWCCLISWTLSFSDMITIIVLTSIMVMMTTTIVIVIIMTMIHIILIYQPPSHWPMFMLEFFASQRRIKKPITNPREVQGWDATQTVNMHGTGGMPFFRIFGRKSLMEHIRPAGSDFYMRSTSSDFYHVFSCWIITVSHFDQIVLKTRYIWRCLSYESCLGSKRFRCFATYIRALSLRDVFYRTRSKKGTVRTCLRTKDAQNKPECLFLVGKL